MRRLFALLVLAALAAPLPSCSLRRFIGPAFPFVPGRAIIRSSTGAEVVVLSDSDPLFADEMFRLAWRPAVGFEGFLKSRFKRALQRRLTAAAADPVLRARFGDAPCLVEEPQLDWTERRGGTDTLPAEETGPEIPLCTEPAPPPLCEEGESAVLGLSMTEIPFGAVPLGTASVQDVTVTNEGGGFLCLGSVVAYGANLRDYSVDDTECRPPDPDQARRLLGPGDSCTVQVTFRPERQGVRDARLRVTSSTQPVLREIPITGQGEPGTLLPREDVCLVPQPDGCYTASLSVTNPGPGHVRFVWAGFLRSGASSGWETAECSMAPEPFTAGSTITCMARTCDLAAAQPNRVTYVTSGLRDDADGGSFQRQLLPPSACP